MSGGAPNEPPLLGIRELAKTYPGTRALDGVSLTVGAREILGLAGHNGAGKSTLTKLLAGVEQPDSGTIELGGEAVRLRNPEVAVSHGVALVPQRLMLVPNLTVRENIVLGAPPARSEARWFGGAADAAGAVDLVAERLDLGPLLNRKAAAIRPVSQRLAMIGRALLRDPRLMILDEPTANLAQAEVQLLFELIRRTVEHGAGIVFITHRLEEMMELADRIVVMRQGRVIAESLSEQTSKPQLAGWIAGADLAGQLQTMAAAVDVHGVDTPPHLSEGGETEEVLRCERLTALPSTREVSFSLRRGQVLGLAGLDGSGRTSLLRALWGDRRRDSGEIFVRGEPTELNAVRDAIRCGIAYLPEERASGALFPEMTVGENVTLPSLARFVGPSRLVRRSREVADVQALLERLDARPLEGASEAKISTFSGGNQQKMVIARWLLHGADIFMFDEPTQGIDVGAKEQVYEVIGELAADGAGILIASSEPEELERLCDIVLLMRDGAVVGSLSGDDISERRISQALMVGA